MAEHQSHTHEHDTQHGHEHGHDYAEANKQYFDENLDLFERPDVVDATRRIAAGMREKYPSVFNAETTTVLDYACGTGLFSRELSPHVKSILGVDISPKVVEEYNSLASKHGLSEKLKAICVELKGNGQLNGLEHQFDVVLCTMAYHHFASPEDVTKTLVSFVKPGGSLLIVDHLTDSALNEDIVRNDTYKHVVPHRHGFDESRVKDMFTGAGLAEFQMGVLIAGLPIQEHTVTLFLARGVKPL